MNAFDIRINSEKKEWRVTLRKDLSLEKEQFKKGDVVFSFPIGDNKHTDMKYIIGQLVTKLVVHDDNRFSSLDNALGFVPSDKFIPITVYSNSPTKSPMVERMFTNTIINETIRGYGVSAAMRVDAGLARYVSGAYVSTVPTLENIITLRDKMGKGSAKLDIDKKLLFCAVGMVINQLKPEVNRMGVSMEPDVVDHFKFNPVAGNGYKHFNIPMASTKNNIVPFARAELKKILEELKDYIGRSECRIPPQVHNFSAKPEVRDVDAEAGKIRLIGMVGHLHDMISRITSTPFITAWRRAPCNLIGSSVWGSLTQLLMLTLEIPEFNDLDEQSRLGVTIPEQEKSFLITFDIKGQDVSYKTAQLFIFNLMKVLWCDLSDKSQYSEFMELFAWEVGSSTVRLTQWFGDQWYLIIALMCSGSLLTADFNTLFSYVMSTAALIKLLLPHKIHPMEIKKRVKFAFYGDDWIWKLPYEWLSFVGEDSIGYPNELAKIFRTWGIELKQGETQIYKPNKYRGNPFFTEIKNDEIVREGVHFLQRYFVKYDIKMRPVNPNAQRNGYAWILPWRKTAAFATKLATDAWGFKGKPGRKDSRDLNPYLGAYVKAFGLLMDAGPNLKAHRMIKEFMSLIAQEHPLVPKISYEVCRGPLNDMIQKLGEKQVESMLPVITEIYSWPTNASMRYVVSRMGMNDDFLVNKWPLYLPKFVRSVNDADNRKPVIRNGEIVYVPK